MQVLTPKIAEKAAKSPRIDFKKDVSKERRFSNHLPSEPAFEIVWGRSGAIPTIITAAHTAQTPPPPRQRRDGGIGSSSGVVGGGGDAVVAAAVAVAEAAMALATDRKSVV